jgi:3-dehydroquinate synthetase
LAAPVALPPLDEAAFSQLILHDKKAAQRAVKFIVLRGIGHADLREGTTPAELWPIFQRFIAAVPGLLTLAPR